jgi:hypothetical protein
VIIYFHREKNNRIDKSTRTLLLTEVEPAGGLRPVQLLGQLLVEALLIGAVKEAHERHPIPQHVPPVHEIIAVSLKRRIEDAVHPETAPRLWVLPDPQWLGMRRQLDGRKGSTDSHPSCRCERAQREKAG